MKKLFFNILLLIFILLAFPKQVSAIHGLDIDIDSTNGKSWDIVIGNSDDSFETGVSVDLEFGAFWCNQTSDSSCDDNNLDYRGLKTIQNFSVNAPATGDTITLTKTFDITKSEFPCGTVQGDVSQTSGTTGATFWATEDCLRTASLTQVCSPTGLSASWDLGYNTDPSCQIKIEAGSILYRVPTNQCQGSWTGTSTSNTPVSDSGVSLSIHNGGIYKLWAGNFEDENSTVTLNCAVPLGEPIPVTVTISGRVTDFSTGNGINGVQITIYDDSKPEPKSATATTDSNGNYSLSNHVRAGDFYTVKPPASPPPGYLHPPNPQSHESQRAGGTPDCGSNCDFKYTLLGDFSVSCLASPMQAAINQEVTWTARIEGTVSSPTYSWSGDVVPPSGTTSEIKRSFSSGGTKNATVEVTSGTTTRSGNCSVNISSPGTMVLSAQPICSGGPAAKLESSKLEGALSYDVYRNNSKIATVSGTGNGSFTYQDNNLSANTKYTYQIKSGSAQSNTASVTTTSCTSGVNTSFNVTASTACSTSPNRQNITVSWTDAPAYNSYKPYINMKCPIVCPNGFDGQFDLAPICGGNSAGSYTFTDRRITGEGGTYSYKVGVVPYWNSECNTSSSQVEKTVTNAICAAPPPPPSAFIFDLIDGGNKTIRRGSQGSNLIKVNLTSGTTQLVTLSATGFPTDVVHSFSQTSCNPTCSSTLKMNVAQAAPTGKSTIIVTGTGEGFTDTDSFTLAIPDDTPPSASLDGTFLGCYDKTSDLTTSWAKRQPIKATATDNQGVASVTFRLTNQGSAEFKDFSAVFKSGPPALWEKVIVGTNFPGGVNNQYKLQVKATDLANNSSLFESSTAAIFHYKDSCANLTPWVQTFGGDVHANTSIETPGGP